MKILFYNWVQFDDPERRGGGVRVYQSNVVDQLARSTDHEVTVLSSGLEHDFVNRGIRIEETANTLRGRVRSFTLVNSTIPAPGHHSFGSRRIFDEGPMLSVWHRFLDEHGPFDVIQFDSLEGIPFTFLRIHESHPRTRVLVYAHNYYMICPQVNLWKQERAHCEDFRDGRDCVNCVPRLADATEVVRAHQVSRLLRAARVDPGSGPYRFAYRVYAWARHQQGRVRSARRLANLLLPLPPKRATPLTGRGAGTPPGSAVRPAVPVSLRQPAAPPTSRERQDPAVFLARRLRGTALINRETDLVLATSHRVKEVLAGKGIDAGKIAVAYIGTRAAGDVEQATRRAELRVPGQLTLAYLGYVRRDKGFPFLLETLERCPDELLARLRLVVAAKALDPLTQSRLATLADSMVDVTYFDGYTHDQLPAILETVDVGVVPVQWEDNLPQVAIEMVANGVPLITSDRGGAKELGGDNPAFVFTATSQPELIETWRRLVDGEVTPGGYWSDAVELVSMQAHLSRLMQLYRMPRADGRAEPVRGGAGQPCTAELA